MDVTIMETVSHILMRWANKMFEFNPYLLTSTRNSKLAGVQRELKDFLGTHFPKIVFAFGPKGDMSPDCYINAYIVLATYWYCNLKCARTIDLFSQMNRREKDIIVTIMGNVTGNEGEITSERLNVIITDSVNEYLYQTPDNTIVEPNIDPTPKTKKLNDLIVENRESFICKAFDEGV